MGRFSVPRLLVSIGIVVGIAWASGCGGMGSGTPPPTGGSSVDMATSYKTPIPPPAPQLWAGTGRIIAAPRVIPIFFKNDALQNSLMTFLQSYMSSSASWQVLSDYGVGRGTVGSAVVLNNTLPATLTDSDVTDLIVSGVQAGTLPAPDASIIYLFYFPASTTITRGSDASCREFQGYHNAVTFPDTSKAAYALVPRCGPQLALLTIATSHELAEAATDPLIVAYNEMNDPYDLWGFNLNGSEVGDLCENLSDLAVIESGIGAVSRLWSNSAAAAFKNPCRPAPASSDIFAVPVLSALRPVQINGRLHNVEVVQIPAGHTRSVEVHLLSQLNPSPTWTVTALEVPLPASSGAGGTPSLTLVWQEASLMPQVTGKSGDLFHLDLTVPATTPPGLTTFRLTSTMPTSGGGQTQTMWVGAVEITK